MRTTVTLDPDVAARLRQLAQERGTSLTEAINAALRVGIAGGVRSATRYRERTASMGVRPGIDLTKALRLASDLEDEATIRELELRK